LDYFLGKEFSCAAVHLPESPAGNSEGSSKSAFNEFFVTLDLLVNEPLNPTG